MLGFVLFFAAIAVGLGAASLARCRKSSGNASGIAAASSHLSKEEIEVDYLRRHERVREEVEQEMRRQGGWEDRETEREDDLDPDYCLCQEEEEDIEAMEEEEEEEYLREQMEEEGEEEDYMYLQDMEDEDDR